MRILGSQLNIIDDPLSEVDLSGGSWLRLKDGLGE